MNIDVLWLLWLLLAVATGGVTIHQWLSQHAGGRRGKRKWTI